MLYLGFGSDPFASSDPFSSKSNGSKSSSDPFTANFADFNNDFDSELAWAKADSERVESERRRKLAEQEKADFEFALALSKAESNA